MNTMTEEHKEKMRVARQASRARKIAVDAEVLAQDGVGKNAEANELEALRKELAELKSQRPRERAAHEHETISGREKINDPGVIGGAQEEIQNSLRELIREQLAETFPERQPVRTTARDSIRPGAVIAHDRDGNVIYRKRDQTRDPFAIPEEMQDPNWSYQWCRVSVHGQEDVGHQVKLQESGWRFVPADRADVRGKFMPESYKGHVFRDGLALMERPAALTAEAQREASELVRQQSFAQRQQFGLRLPEGFSDKTESAKAFTFAKAGPREAIPETLKPNLRPGGAMDID